MKTEKDEALKTAETNAIEQAAETNEQVAEQTNAEEYDEKADFKATALALRKANPDTVRITDSAIINDVTISSREGDFGEYRMYVLTLNKKVKGFVAKPDLVDELGNQIYTEGVTTQIFIPENQFLACMRQHKDTLVQRLSKELRISDETKVVTALLGCEIGICQQQVVAGDEYTSPFTKNPRTVVVPNNSYYNTVITFQPSKDLRLELDLKQFSDAGHHLSFAEFLAAKGR